MDALELSDSQLTRVIGQVWPHARWARQDVLWEWPLSRVERLTVPGHPSVVVKRSRSPLTDEGCVLEALSESAIPLPEVYLSHADGGLLTLLMEDLGPSAREPNEAEAAAYAVLVHSARPPAGLEQLGSDGLRGLVVDTRDGIESLASSGRWKESAGRMLGLSDRLDGVATALSEAAEVPPFGLCHSEFHPTSLHVGTFKTALVDWACFFGLIIRIRSQLQCPLLACYTDEAFQRP